MSNIKIRAIIDCSFPMVQWKSDKSGKLYYGQSFYAVKLLDALVNTRDDEVNIALDKVVFIGDVIPNTKISSLIVTNPAELTALGKNYPSYSPPEWHTERHTYNLIDLMGSNENPPIRSIMEEVKSLYDDVAKSTDGDNYIFIVFANSTPSCDNGTLEKIVSHIENGYIPLLSVYYVNTESKKDKIITDLLDPNVIRSGLARIQDASRRVSRDAKVPYQSYRQCVRILSLRSATMDKLEADIVYFRKLIKDACTKSSRI